VYAIANNKQWQWLKEKQMAVPEGEITTSEILETESVVEEAIEEAVEEELEETNED
jgi:hypothetical protein